MSIRDTLKRSDRFVRTVHALRTVPRRLARPREISGYLAGEGFRGLHLGASGSHLEGWLNTDLYPKDPSVVFLDATRPFPLPDEAFDAVYSEHMIEHISWTDGLFMLRECLRVLRPGGTVRIATPDLESLLSLHDPDGDPRRSRYVRWITDTFLPDVDTYHPCFVINNALRSWGHRFIYDADVLRLTLERAGFEHPVRSAFGRSAHPELQGIESHGRGLHDMDLVEFETLIMEATRPSS